MRLLHSSSLELKDFADSVPPRYAILSHLWGPDEATIEDFRGSRNISDLVSQGHHKIKNCCMQAQRDGIQWVWIDSCCIDGSIRDELSDTINSMYKWLENSHVCYAYLSTVSGAAGRIMPTFERCKWFHRKWTLQELVAPPSVVFFAEDWSRIGTRGGLSTVISKITGIQSAVLTGLKKPKQCHVSERMAWALNRKATAVEDEAYSIMGLFDIQMEIRYGEGSRAFRRLQDLISQTHYSSDLETSRTVMRLLVTKSVPLEIRSFAGGDSPEYAILSHTWGPTEEEISFSDVCQGNAESKVRAYLKVRKCCELAASHGFDYIWIDTCCIDKTSSAELQEAICSMFRWYKSARICYVYLEDFLTSSETPNLWQCKWFTRGWTLQELIAPTFVEFYDRNWVDIGTKASLCEHIADVTGIDSAVLRGSDPTERTVAERMSWAASRSTTRVEDAAYCLMGLFNVFMPMLYGEGSRAFTRLQEEIMRQSEDYTIFAWTASFMSGNRRGLLAHSPTEFRGGKSVCSRRCSNEQDPESPPTPTSRGLLLDLPLQREYPGASVGEVLAWVGSSNSSESSQDSMVCIWLKEIQPRPQTFARVSPSKLELLPPTEEVRFRNHRIYVLPYGTQSEEDTYDMDRTRSGMILVQSSSASRAQPTRAMGIPFSITLAEEHYQDLAWNPTSGELLYSNAVKNCVLAALVLKQGQSECTLHIGLRDDLPWCSIDDLDIRANSTHHAMEASKSIQDLIESCQLLKQTDRASKILADGSKVTATLRAGCSTSVNPTIFKLDLRWDQAEVSKSKHRVVYAPNNYTKEGAAVFLSGYIDESLYTWQESLCASLAHLPITILNPHRPDWDSSWHEDVSFSPFAEQATWELAQMEQADVIAICFGVKTQAPITLMELGLWAGSGKCVVACPEGYPKRGNVQIVCQKYGIQILENAAELSDAVIRKLTELGKL